MQLGRFRGQVVLGSSQIKYADKHQSPKAQKLERDLLPKLYQDQAIYDLFKIISHREFCREVTDMDTESSKADFSLFTAG